MRRRTAWFASMLVALTAAVALAENGGHTSLVPWKVLEPGAAPEQSPLVLYWIPESREELRRSPLLISDELTLYSSQCVAMRIVRLDDFALLRRLRIAADEIPTVVLFDREGDLVAYADPSSVADVESIVRDELEHLAADAEEMLDRAREKADAGEIEAAKEIYREVWSRRCVCPRQGKEAGKALKKLGK